MSSFREIAKKLIQAGQRGLAKEVLALTEQEVEEIGNATKRKKVEESIYEFIYACEYLSEHLQDKELARAIKVARKARSFLSKENLPPEIEEYLAGKGNRAFEEEVTKFLDDFDIIKQNLKGAMQTVSAFRTFMKKYQTLSDKLENKGK